MLQHDAIESRMKALLVFHAFFDLYSIVLLKKYLFCCGQRILDISGLSVSETINNHTMGLDVIYRLVMGTE